MELRPIEPEPELDAEARAFFAKFDGLLDWWEANYGPAYMEALNKILYELVKTGDIWLARKRFEVLIAGLERLGGYSFSMN